MKAIFDRFQETDGYYWAHHIATGEWIAVEKVGDRVYFAGVTQSMALADFVKFYESITRLEPQSIYKDPPHG